jgi:16S rRNA (cytidine1402-2'-O)-methyltransferase
MPVLYLIPSFLSDNTLKKVIPDEVIKIITNLKQFVVEDIRSARRFISRVSPSLEINKLVFKELNEHSKEDDFVSLSSYLLKNDTGLLSEVGMPCIADPGAELVKIAHANGIKVVPLVGPSSILMALMASGFNGQSFSFVGYLPIKEKERKEALKVLEQRSLKEKQTQIFIETPYRNISLLNDILKYCRPETMLSIAADITGKTELIISKSIREWKNNLPNIHKIPTVFLLQA